MKVNLLESRRVYVPSGPYKALTQQELAFLVNGDSLSNELTVSSETLALEVDLGARYRLEEIQYYRTAAQLENITFFGKQGEDASHPWIELPYVDLGSFLQVDLSSSLDRYEFVRIFHTVLTGSAEVFELEVFSSDAASGFGEEATATVFSVDSGTNTLLEEPVPIFNASDESNTFFVALEGGDADSSGTGVSLTASGTYYKLAEKGLFLPEDFSWSAGQLENLTEVTNTLVLTSGTSGTFYSPVLDISSLGGRRLLWQATLSGSSVIDDPAREDSVPTVLVRYSNQQPTDGGWSSGQLSTDSNWSLVSGTLPWQPYDNYHIMHPSYLDYLQFRVDFSSPSDGETPVLNYLGVESALNTVIASKTFSVVYVKSFFTEHVPSRETKLLVWSFNSDNQD